MPKALGIKRFTEYNPVKRHDTPAKEIRRQWIKSNGGKFDQKKYITHLEQSVLRYKARLKRRATVHKDDHGLTTLPKEYSSKRYQDSK